MSIYKMRTDFGKYLKPILFLIALIFLVGAIWSFGVAPTRRGPGPEGVTGIVAKVNGVEVSRADFEAAWDRAAEEARSRGVRSALAYADLRAGEFQRMVNDITLLDAAKQMGVDISEDRVDAEIEKVVTQELNQNREAVLGKLDRKRAAMDPRDDDEYRSELASIGSSLAQQEEIAKAKYPESQVRAMIARQGIIAKIKAGIKPVTEADVTASYNVYKIRQVILQRDKRPQEQLMSKANKIASEARSGADFAKLARENSPGQAGMRGDIIDLTFENSFGYPQQAMDAVRKMKPGDVSSPIQTDYAVFIVKLEGIVPKMPANLDKKARDARRDQIAQMREMMAASEFQQRMERSQRVEVLDPEILGYWQLYQSQRFMGNPVEAKKQRKMAINSLMRARTERPGNPIAISKLAQLLYEDGKVEESVRLLYPMLEGETATQEGADLRILLGDMLIKKGEKDRAIQQYKIASEVARNDPGVHQQLIMKFQQLKRPDLVAAENKWMADYNRRVEEMKAMQRKTPGRPPLGGGTPPGPTPPPGPRE